MNTANRLVGKTVTVVPIGQTRRQQVYVARVFDAVDDMPAIATGYLVSKKYPGDYRGRAAFYVADLKHT